ncbi:hypothetical protein HPT27_11945 [Permianibacter sp. IMCC34836]|uniref:hypothetical protein n=1 Tax=Permianibacter fluminis TaxID=2738515 RepID=UPI001554EBD4|nr:hypothetical protein [Permianibacter fluminis]NQD37739.1 hypothetical protein [Permianibacter fluminis]
MPQLNSTFIALLKEAQFTKELLGAGATEIRRANYTRKGLYFQSFTSLSTGLERIGKLCLMLDYYIDTRGCFPDFKYLKNEIGHNLTLLQEKAADVIARRKLNIETPSTPVHQAIISLLSDFAEGDRYSNINFLVGSNRQSDPIAAWFTQVDLPLFKSRITANKKQKIADNARAVSQLIGPFAQVLYTSETGSEITDVEEASNSTGIFEAVAPYRQLHVLQIIRFWSELLRELQHLSQSIGKDDIPFLCELFAAFRNDDAYMKTRKTWDTV